MRTLVEVEVTKSVEAVNSGDVPYEGFRGKSGWFIPLPEWEVLVPFSCGKEVRVIGEEPGENPDEPDSITTSVCDKLQSRSAVGQKKYGTSMERTDLSRLDWLRHAQEEAMDLAVYLEKLIQEEEADNANS